MLRTMLVRFDAIFTLNQDVLLEHHYAIDLITSGRRVPAGGATVCGCLGGR